DRLHLIQRVAHERPPLPRSIDPGIPRDLEVILLKATEKDSARRYASAAALAEDLGRFLADQPIHARPLAPWHHLARWVKRHPAVALLSALLLLVSSAGLAVGLWQWQKTEDALVQVTKQRDETEREQSKTASALAAEEKERANATAALARAEYNLYL